MNDSPSLTPIVYLVEDDASSLHLLQTFLAAERYRTVSYTSAVKFLEEFKDDPGQVRCLVTDLVMPQIDGLALQQKLVERNVRMPVIFVTGQGQVAQAVEAMKLGAVDFLEKPLDVAKLRDVVRRAIDRDLSARDTQISDAAVTQRMQLLTRREREVMDLLVEARSTKEIASHLGINLKTVFVHRARVMEKMGVESLVELSQLAAPVLQRANSGQMDGASAPLKLHGSNHDGLHHS